MRTLILLFSKDGNRFYCEQGCVSSREDIQEVCKALLGECVNMSIPKPKISVEDIPEGITGNEAVTIKGRMEKNMFSRLLRLRSRATTILSWLMGLTRRVLTKRLANRILMCILSLTQLFLLTAHVGVRKW